MSESEIRFSFSPEEESRAANVLGIPIQAEAVFSQYGHKKANHGEISDPRAELRSKGRLDLGAKGALRSADYLTSRFAVRKNTK